MVRRCYVSYASANEDIRYLRDFVNFRHLCRYDPGVEKVSLFFACGQVRTPTALDDEVIARLKTMCKNTSALVPRDFFLKPNSGRDWGSLHSNFLLIREEADPEDYVWIMHRSTAGPFKDGWLKEYIDLYERHEGTAACGTTLFLQLPSGEDCDIPSHVQAYGILTQVKHLEGMLDEFPGVSSSSTREAIVGGEVEFSRRLLKEGYKISCLQWSERAFSIDELESTDLPRGCHRAEMPQAPFRHRAVTNIYPSNIRDIARSASWVRDLAKTEPKVAEGIILDSIGVVREWVGRRLRTMGLRR